MNKTTNQTNQTKGNETQTHLQDLMQERNKLIKWLEYDTNELAQCGEFESINAEIVQTISEMATYKTLKFLMSNNATNGTATESNENGTINTYGYNMALKLFNNLYNDINIMHNGQPQDSFSDSADLIQESNKTLIPYFNNNIVFDLDDIIFTKQCKNGNIKEYTAFQVACKSIRAYIQAQDKKQYKKLSYVIGFTENGKQVTTTKKPKNDIADIEQEQRKRFISKYHLTDFEQVAILNHINGLSTTESAEKLQVSKRTIERALKSARDKISSIDKRIRA